MTEEAPGLDLVLIGGPQLFVIVTIAAVLAMLWVFVDARRREVPNPGIWAGTVGFLFLFYVIPGLAGLVIYTVLRESDIREGSDRSP